jgi:hypothetical protein
MNYGSVYGSMPIVGDARGSQPVASRVVGTVVGDAQPMPMMPMPMMMMPMQQQQQQQPAPAQASRNVALMGDAPVGESIAGNSNTGGDLKGKVRPILFCAQSALLHLTVTEGTLTRPFRPPCASR